MENNIYYIGNVRQSISYVIQVNNSLKNCIGMILDILCY